MKQNEFILPQPSGTLLAIAGNCNRKALLSDFSMERNQYTLRSRKFYCSKTVFIAAAVSMTVIIVFSLVFAGAGKPDWKIGRAVISKRARADDNRRKEPFLKLSIRNKGPGGTEQVAIYGRWSGKKDRTGRRYRAGRDAPPLNQAPVRRAQKGSLRDFFRLGLFTREVARKQTAILEVSLRSLGPMPRNARSVELIILSGQVETDRRFIPVPDSFSR